LLISILLFTKTSKLVLNLLNKVHVEMVGNPSKSRSVDEKCTKSCSL